MPFKSTPARYGSVAIFIHWATAVAIALLLFSGFRAAGMEGASGQVGLLRFHVVLGFAVFALTIVRILWWTLVDKRPATSGNTARWQRIAAHAVHGILYLVILMMGASGVGMIALSGAGEALFGGGITAMPNFWDYAPRAPHGIGARLLMTLAALHIGAALYHQFILKDRLLARMGVGAD